MTSEWSQFWWKNITGANYIVNSVVETLLDNNTAILNVPYDLPWRHDMRAEMETTYRALAESDNVIVDQLDDLDERNETISIGRFLLNRNGKKGEVINGFRERAGKTIQEYLIANEVLRGRIIWVKGLSQKSSKDWISFVENYQSKSSNDGLFVLEVPGEIVEKNYSNSRIIKYEDYVTDNDVQLLNSFILSDSKTYSEEWKKYISVVSAKLCDIDAEASAWLVDNISFMRMEPIEAIGRLNVKEDFRMRGSGPESAKTHVLGLYRSNEMVALKNRVWTAQVRTLFPLIEIEKHDIIEKYYDEIQSALKLEEYRQYEKIITDPFELEIGSLYYLITSKDYAGMYKLYIPDERVRNRVDLLRRCRNKIAHSNCCTPEEINNLISKDKD